MSILARSALRARAPAALRSTGIQRRALHVENTASNVSCVIRTLYLFAYVIMLLP